jgi:hypothetical protein
VIRKLPRTGMLYGRVRVISITKRLVLSAVVAGLLSAGICSAFFFPAAPDVLKAYAMAAGIPLTFAWVWLFPGPQPEVITPGTGEAELGRILMYSGFISWFLIFFALSFLIITHGFRKP